MISHAFDENGLVKEEIYKKLLLGKLEVNEGMIFENVVAQMLVASGHKLYFCSGILGMAALTEKGDWTEPIYSGA